MVRLFVCSSVCLLATSGKNYCSHLREDFTTELYLWTRKSSLNLGSHLDPLWSADLSSKALVREYDHSASVVQACRDSPSLSSPPSSSPTTECQSFRSVICQVSQLSVTRVRRNSFGTRAFSVVGPAVWKSLPDHLHDPPVDCKHFRSVRICLLDIRNVRTLEVLHNHALQISIYFPLMLLILSTVCAF